MAFDAREFWDFDDPASSEIQFRNLIETSSISREEFLEVWAQIARTFSLRRDCPKCHALLDEHWDEAMESGGRPKACFELERGRAFRSGKEVDRSIPFFQSAAQSEADDLKVDAMHMLAIIAEPQESIRINQEALKLALDSSSHWAQRWEGSLCNNLAWSFFEAKDFPMALGYFQQALDARIKFEQTGGIRIAIWCLGHCYRMNGNLDEALKIQLELSELEPDGYVSEEIGEILLAQGKDDEAMPHFAKAVELLEAEFGADSERIQRMKSLSK
ncbi:MAG: tetratricopeptide repeat protein [Armatimonadota bacterium]